MKNYVNILWLSDIHFQEAYTTEKTEHTDNITELIDSFIETVITYQSPKNGKIDYIFISGDLAHSGKEADYEMFYEHFIRKLVEGLSSNSHKPIFLSIPGNHDVDWEGISPKFYLSKETPFTRYNGKNKTISDEKAAFLKIFNNYSRFAKKNIEFPKDSERFQAYIGDNHLFGYVIDKLNRVVFILLNSAWFSFGSEGENIIKSSLEDEEDRNKMRAYFAEMGGQIVGETIFNAQRLRQLLIELDGPCNDYVVITSMHHPFHWLEWGELYSQVDPRVKTLFLVKLLQRTHILLTGHEHLPTYIRPTTRTISAQRNTEHSYIHFEAGMFLENNSHKSDIQFLHNRFTILQLNNVDCTLIEHSYLYKPDTNNGSWEKKSFILPDTANNFKYDVFFQMRKNRSVSNELSYREEAKKIFDAAFAKPDSKFGPIYRFLIKYHRAPESLRFEFSRNDSLNLIFGKSATDEIVCVFVLVPKNEGLKVYFKQNGEEQDNPKGKKNVMINILSSIENRNDIRNIQRFEFLVLDLYAGVDAKGKDYADRYQEAGHQWEGVYTEIVDLATNLLNRLKDSLFDVQTAFASQTVPSVQSRTVPTIRVLPYRHLALSTETENI